SVVLIPDSADRTWEATITAFAETLEDGFAGELCLIGAPAALARASEVRAAAGARVRLIEGGGSIAQRARAAAKASGHRMLVFVTAPAVPLPDWLPSLLALFSRDERAGVFPTRRTSESFGHPY